MLLVLATWVRLGASDVVIPEAYTLPVTVPALAIGVLRRRRDAEASSWTAYGPGLAATLLPSLIAAWGDQHWLRPLLLGAAALALTLTGARHRLQALLVLGSAVLALVALHELAPYVAQVVGALPRWLPPALAGLLLLAVGATSSSVCATPPAAGHTGPDALRPGRPGPGNGEGPEDFRLPGLRSGWAILGSNQ